MNIEAIKKTAREYAKNKYGGENAKQWAIAQIHAGRDGFVDGANWRINSAWHDADENPKFCGKVEEEKFLVLYNSGECGLVQVSQDDWEDARELTNFAKWAYVSDLLPDRKEAHL